MGVHDGVVRRSLLERKQQREEDEGPSALTSLTGNAHVGQWNRKQVSSLTYGQDSCRGSDTFTFALSVCVCVTGQPFIIFSGGHDLTQVEQLHLPNTHQVY